MNTDSYPKTPILPGQPYIAAALQPQLRPLPLGRAVLYFALPALLFRLCLYNGLPLLIRLGLSPFEASVVSFTVPAAILFALALGFYKADGWPLSWQTLRARFRLQSLRPKDWFWSLVALVVSFLSIGAVGFTGPMLIAKFPALAPPDFFPPWLQPGASLSSDLFSSYIGAPLAGNWGVLVLFAVMLFFNILGEELWWRGYIFPRQELVHGRWTWLVHGLLWLLWHVVFYPWQLFALLPICLILPFTAQRLRSTTVALIIHTQNAAVILLVLALVLGIG